MLGIKVEIGVAKERGPIGCLSLQWRTRRSAHEGLWARAPIPPIGMIGILERMSVGERR